MNGEVIYDSKSDHADQLDNILQNLHIVAGNDRDGGLHTLRLASLLTFAVQKEWDINKAELYRNIESKDNIPDDVLHEEQEIITALEGSASLRKGMALQLLAPSIIKLFKMHPHIESFAVQKGFTLLTYMLTDDLELSEYSKLPPLSVGMAAIGILRTLPEVFVGRSCEQLRESRLAGWVNFIAKYPSFAHCSTQLKDDATALVQAWRRSVRLAQASGNAIQELGSNDDPSIQKPRGRNVESERQMAERKLMANAERIISKNIAHLDETASRRTLKR